jgi:uroporphyrinogen-III synthase
MRRLYILRPEPGSSATAERARAMGLDAHARPLFRIEPLRWQVADASHFDALLLTSANAARCAGVGLDQFRGLPAYSVGEATAAAAREAGLQVAAVGTADLHALLQLVPPDLRLLHLCGVHRTDRPATSHPITAVPVYCADALPVSGLTEELRDQVAAVHSPRAAARLAELVAPDERRTIRVAAISAAAAGAAGTGWAAIMAARSPSDAALLALAARLCEEGGRQ